MFVYMFWGGISIGGILLGSITLGVWFLVAAFAGLIFIGLCCLIDTAKYSKGKEGKQACLILVGLIIVASIVLINI